MLNYFLDNQPIPGPLQADGLTLRKELNRIYWGFLYRKLGYVPGGSNLRFEDADTVSLLRYTVDRYGVQGQTALRIEQNGDVLYDGYIDYSTYHDDSTGISVALRDDKAISDLSSQATTVFGLTASGSLLLHTRRLGGVPGLVVDTSQLVVQRASSSAVSLSHSVPLIRRTEFDESVAGALSDVKNPLNSEPIYTNQTSKDQLVTLTGMVSATVNSSVSNTIELRAVPVGNESSMVHIGSYSVNNTPKLINVAVSVQLWVKVGQSLRLDWSGSANAANWKFIYGNTTVITVADEPIVSSSSAYGLSVGNAFSQLVNKSTSGKLSFVSNFLSFDPDGALFLANGVGVRGLKTTLSVSLQGLFVGLSKIFNLCLWVDGTTVRLERKGNRPQTTTRLEAVLTRTESIATEFLYNSVKAGYAVWQADDSALSNDEPNGQRSYSTGITAVRNELDLISDLITASNVIEQQRRKQFDAQTASTAKANTLDNSLFLIASVGSKAETTERTQSASGVYDPATLYNTRMTVGRNLSRWTNELGPSLPLTTEFVQGSETMQSTYANEAVTESEPVSETASKSPRLVTITTPFSLIDYAQAGDFIEYPFGGNLRTGELLTIEWQLTKTGETATITLLEN